MANFDPQQPADKSRNPLSQDAGQQQNTDGSGSAAGNPAGSSESSQSEWSYDASFDGSSGRTASRQWEYACGEHSTSPVSRSCCQSGNTSDCQEPEACGLESSHAGSAGSESFFADWSAADGAGSESAVSASADAQARPFEPRATPSSQPESFWVELVRSQRTSQDARAIVRVGGAAPGEQFWADLVASQQPTSTYDSVPVTTTRPTGMGWADEEAGEWSPPEREVEPVREAAEPVEFETAASARRDDVEWSVPASAQDEWEAARSEGMGESRSLMAAAVEAANAPKAKKPRAAKPAGEKKPAEKKVAAKKTTARAKKPAASKAKKPAAAKKAAKKPVAKKVVKKVAPPPRITKAPTRRAA